MPEYHRPWVVPVRHLVALFEVFNDLRAVRAAQLGVALALVDEAACLFST